MEEAACISYNNAIEELRAKEYRMLQGKSLYEGWLAYTHPHQEQRTLTMPARLSTPSR
jgi:hypothetical protein